MRSGQLPDRGSHAPLGRARHRPVALRADRRREPLAPARRAGAGQRASAGLPRLSTRATALTLSRVRSTLAHRSPSGREPQTVNWNLLLSRIESGNCTPFLGAGAAAGTLPLGGDIARRWADESGYPLSDIADLARVAQFIAVHDDPMAPKERLCAELKKHALPDFANEDEPHAALADLPLSVFVTTNYDDFMLEALRSKGKDPKREICRWRSEERRVGK